MEKLANGIYKYQRGEQDPFSPLRLIAEDPKTDGLEDYPCPFSEDEFTYEVTDRGVLFSLPAEEGEDFYGTGLMFKNIKRTGSQMRLRVNSDPVANTGDSHAPVTFYVSTKGYGILVPSSHEVTFSLGNAVKKRFRTENDHKVASSDINTLYAGKKEVVRVNVEIRDVKGIEVIIFAGKDLMDAVARYNLFCGGGALPAMYGTGVMYRMWGGSDENLVLKVAKEIRDDQIPCDMVGLEPGWQSHAYSCSLVPDGGRFPNFYEMVKKAKSLGYKINLWEHVFLHNTSPLYEKMYNYSGDYEVWQGVVPDFTLPEVKEAFSKYHQENYFDKGVDDFKVDECDNSDYSTDWSFPVYSKFPSGASGEQMHQLLGLLLAKTLHANRKKANKRYCSQIRSLGAFGSPYATVLYSDLYGHKDFVRGIINASFSGLLWTPEVRQCDSEIELIRRLEADIFSPFTCIDSWMIPSPPWKQWDFEKNNRGEMAENQEELTVRCKEIISWRMQFLPYIYSRYFEYALYGTPAFRAVILNYPNDERFRECDDEYMIGDDILVAPIDADTNASRKVIFPEGKWINYFTEEVFENETELSNQGRIGVYIRDGALLPLAKVKQYVNEGDGTFEITVKEYGTAKYPCVLYEDDGETFDYEKGIYNRITITKKDGKQTIEKTGTYSGKRWSIKED